MSTRQSAPGGASGADDAVRQMRAAAASRGHDDGPGAPGTADADVVRSALAALPHDDQRLLWDVHVRGRRMDGVARGLGMHERSASRRLRQAEERFAGALSAAHARGGPRRACVETRRDLADYVRHRLGGGRRQLLEDHLFGCAGCLRAFVDVRESAWVLRDAAPVLLAGIAVTGTAVPVVVGASGAAGSQGALLAWLGPLGAALGSAAEPPLRTARRLLGRPVVVAAGVGVAAVALAAGSLVDDGVVLGAGPAPAASPAAAERSASSDGPDVTSLLSPDAQPSEGPTSSPDPSSAPDTTSGPEAAEDAVPDPGPTPSATVPATPPDDEEAAPGPSPEPGTTTGPTATASATPTAAPSTTATAPPATVAPDEPVTTTVTLDVASGGSFRVEPTAGARVVAVSTDRRNVRVEQTSDGSWQVSTTGSSPGTVTVQVSGGPASGARLVATGQQ